MFKEKKNKEKSQLQKQQKLECKKNSANKLFEYFVRLEDDWGARLKDGKCVGLVKTGTCMQASKKQRGQNVLFQNWKFRRLYLWVKTSKGTVLGMYMHVRRGCAPTC